MSRSLNHGFENKCSEETFNSIYNMAFARGKERGFDDGYNKAIDEFAKRLKNHLNEFDFWKYGITDGTNYETRNYDHMIDKIAEQMKGV